MENHACRTASDLLQRYVEQPTAREGAPALPRDPVAGSAEKEQEKEEKIKVPVHQICCALCTTALHLLRSIEVQLMLILPRCCNRMRGQCIRWLNK